MVDQQAKGDRLAAQAEVFADSVLQQGETEDQSGRPQNQQENQRQRSEVAEKILPPRPRRNTVRELSLRDPGAPIEPTGQPEGALHPPGQNHGLERIQQDGQDGENSGNGAKDVHQALGWQEWRTPMFRSMPGGHVSKFMAEADSGLGMGCGQSVLDCLQLLQESAKFS